MFKTIKIPEINLEYEQPIGLFIDNEYQISSNKTMFDSVCPANEEHITSFYVGSQNDVTEAVNSAHQAYNKIWSKTTPIDRSIILDKLCHLTENNKELLAAVETLDTGKPYHSNSIGDLTQMVEVIRFYAGSCEKFTTGITIPSNQDRQLFTQKSPYGVVAIIVPWNYPLAMAAWKIFGCLAAGNTIVIKPSEYTSLSLLFFTRLLVEAGMPPGVVNVIPGIGEVVGKALATNEVIQKISFTGSTRVGRLLLEYAAGSNLKDVTLECGGKSPAVIFEDADIDAAIDWIAGGFCYNTGQNCTATSRLYIYKTKYEAVMSKLLKVIDEKWIVNNPYNSFDKKNVLGPIITKDQYEKVKDYIEYGIKTEKLKVNSKDLTHSKGYFVAPTVFENVPSYSRLAQEEIFGPVLIVNKFESYEEAIQLANDSKYGLAAAAFTRDISLSHKFIRDVQAGTVWINSSNDEEIVMPFGGFKMSGMGRELGASGVDTFLQNKSVHINIGN